MVDEDTVHGVMILGKMPNIPLQHNKNAQDDGFILSPGPTLLLSVRTKFVAQGSSFTAWCKSVKVGRTKAEYALVASGIRSEAVRALRERICRAAGLIDEDKKGIA